MHIFHQKRCLANSQVFNFLPDGPISRTLNFTLSIVEQQLQSYIQSLFMHQQTSFAIRYQQQIIETTKKHVHTHNRSQTIEERQNQNQINNMKLSLDMKANRNKRKIKVQQTNMRNLSNLIDQQHLKRKQEKEEKASLIEFLNGGQEKAPRIPIQYYEDKDLGCGCDFIKGRVVYRGYAAKNSYFYLQAMRDIETVPVKAIKSSSYEYDLEFNSKFESGNLISAVRVSKKEYHLFMRQDTNTHGLRQWYFFQVNNNQSIKVKFRIYKFSKNHSLYKQGMKPYMKKQFEQNSSWQQQGQDVKYIYDDEMRYFKNNRESYLIASMPPYTYSKMMRFLDELREKQYKYVGIKTIGYSLAGIEIPLITIMNSILEKANIYFKYSNNKKSAIIIISRTHPAQTCSSYTLQKFTNNIAECFELNQIFDFFILPMVNVDGVIFGNHRTSLSGMDLNRKLNPLPGQVQLYPELQVIKQVVKMVQMTHNIEFIIDLHGHSAKRNIFAYGEEEQIGSKKHLRSRILPKILSNIISSFKYNYCVFRAVKQKKSTVRVYFSQRYNINTLTFEQSYGLLDEGNIGIRNWENFGVALIDALQQYCSMIKEGQHSIKQYLKVELELENIQKGKQVQKQKKIQTILFNQANKKNLKKQEKIIDENKSERDSQLSSGDEDKQLRENEIEPFKANIFFGFREQKKKNPREQYNLNDHSLKLGPRKKQQMILHEQKLSIMPRILRMKERLKQKNSVSGDIANILTYRRSKDKIEPIRQRIDSFNIRLPNITRFLN